MMTASLLFTLLEGSRYIMLGMMAVINSQSVTESMFAEYNVPAYQNYHLFMMDSGYGTGELLLSRIHARMQELGQENLNPAVRGYGKYSNFLQMSVTDSSIVQYELATDQNASPLLKQITQVMKKEAAVDLVKKITDVQESSTQGKKADKYLDGALETIEQAKEVEQQEDAQKVNGISQNITFRIHAKSAMQMQAENNQNTGPASLQQISLQEAYEQEIENPMEDVKSAKSSPLLAQIISGNSSISAKRIEKADTLEQRTLNIGNYKESSSPGILDKLLVIQYLKKYTSAYQSQKSMPHALAYEQEYILFGKYTDEDNLEKMASRLLLMREGINFAYLLTDQAKCEEAFVLAAAIAAASGIPGAVKAIQMGLLASWSYSESIAELRTLFSGGKIAAVKTLENWTVSLSEVAAVLLDHSIQSREVSGGIDYEDFLDAFLALESLNKIGIRFANLLEKNIRLYAGYEQIKLDCMITAMETDSIYHAQQMFLRFVTITRLSKSGYQYEEKYAFSYADGNRKSVVLNEQK